MLAVFRRLSKHCDFPRRDPTKNFAPFTGIELFRATRVHRRIGIFCFHPSPTGSPMLREESRDRDPSTCSRFVFLFLSSRTCFVGFECSPSPATRVVWVCL